MTELTDEQQILAVLSEHFHDLFIADLSGPARRAEAASALLRLLDAERARADVAVADKRHASRYGWDLGFKAGWSEHDNRCAEGDTASRWWEGETVNPFK